MTPKKKLKKAHRSSDLPIPNELIDQLLANYEKPEDLLGKDGILKQLTAVPHPVPGTFRASNQSA